jgi:hypothetical protein
MTGRVSEAALAKLESETKALRTEQAREWLAAGLDQLLDPWLKDDSVLALEDVFGVLEAVYEALRGKMIVVQMEHEAQRLRAHYRTRDE